MYGMDDLGLSLGLKPLSSVEKSYHDKTKDLGLCKSDDVNVNGNGVINNSDGGPPVQLHLLPVFSPVHHHLQPNPSNNFPTWLNHNLLGADLGRELQLLKRKRGGEELVASTSSSSPNNSSTCIVSSSSFHHTTAMDFSTFRGDDVDEDINGSARKKLRLTKQQSAFLEDTFKQHTTLNPKQKVGLAKQLNLRPRQVEVWFQNRRARTKLKQTEVDCEQLRRCYDKLTQENTRLHKELQELRALNNNSFYMQLPPSTLTMCPSCQRVSTTNASKSSSHFSPSPSRAHAQPAS